MVPILVIKLINIIKVIAQFFETFPICIFKIHVDKDRLKRFIGGAKTLVSQHIRSFAIFDSKMRVGVIPAFNKSIKQRTLNGLAAMLNIEIEPTFSQSVFNVRYYLLLNARFVVSYVLSHEFPKLF